MEDWESPFLIEEDKASWGSENSGAPIGEQVRWREVLVVTRWD